MIFRERLNSVLSLSKQVINKALVPIGFHVTRLPVNQVRTVDRKNPEAAGLDGIEPNARRVLNLLRYTTASGSDYCADCFPAGYHSITLDGRLYSGQRRPSERLAKVPFDFRGKSVLDIGCNQGGMLFELSQIIAWGVGIDYDHRMINAANRIRKYEQVTNLDFFVFDLEKEDLDYIGDFLSASRVDIIFLLSVCMWIKNWQQVVDWASKISDNMLFESNGSEEQQNEQEAYLGKCFRDVTLLATSSDDDPFQNFRKLYLCTNSTPR